MVEMVLNGLKASVIDVVEFFGLFDKNTWTRGDFGLQGMSSE